MVVAQDCDPTHHLGGDEWEACFSYMTRLYTVILEPGHKKGEKKNEKTYILKKKKQKPKIPAIKYY